MTKAKIERVSRSFVGHLITNPKVRKDLHMAVTTTKRGTPEARIARIINRAVGPKSVTPKDVPIIAKRVNALLGVKHKPRPFEKLHTNTRTGIEVLEF